jgi:hypothetical protein
VHHAEDEWSDLVGDILVLPPERKHTNSDDAGVSIRDKVAKMNEWAFANPDEPHPTAGTPSLSVPPADSRVFPTDGRTHRIRYVRDRLEGLCPPHTVRLSAYALVGMRHERGAAPVAVAVSLSPSRRLPPSLSRDGSAADGQGPGLRRFVQEDPLSTPRQKGTRNLDHCLGPSHEFPAR